MITVRQDKEIYEIFTHYDPVIIEMIKQIPGRRWVPERKAWTIPRNNLGFFVNIFKGSEYESQITLLSDENIDINEDLGAHTPIPDIDISNVPFYVKEGAKPYQHQLDFMKWAIHRQNKGNLHGFLLADEMGCISGDAMIHLNWHKSYSQITLRDLYQHWIKHPNCHEQGEYKIRCLRDNIFRLHDVKDIIYSGNKPVYELKLSGGYSLKATADHEILTEMGYVPLNALSAGDKIVTNGQPACIRCGSAKDICTYKTAKYRGYCRKCMYELRSAAHKIEYSELKDADGYILCRGSSIPSWHGFTWSDYIYKHRLVMEDHLGRKLNKDEVVHHINGVRDDNRLENLELTTIHDHHRLQHDETSKLYSVDRKTRWGNDIIIVPKYQIVESIQYVGVEDTYDIKMYEPYHNFLANGVVVHNCGKSVEVTNLALYNRDKYNLKHCLIICCINSGKYNWQKDIEVHTRGKEHAYILGSRLKRDGSFKPDTGNKEKFEDLNTLKMYSKDEPLPYFIIMNIEAFRYKDKKNYPIADRIIQLINNDEIDMVVIDEIHKNASPEATQGKQLLRVKKATSNAMWIPMTGTPIVKDPSNLYTPLKLCDVHRFSSYWSWCQEFIIYAGFGSHDIVGYKNIPKLKQMLESNMIRRLKEDVLDLPPKIYYTEYIDNSPYQRKLYNEIAHQLQESRDEIIKLLNPLAKFLRLRQVNGSPELVDTAISPDDSNYLEKNARLKRLLELLEDAHARGEKTVVFSNWVEPLRTLYKYISKKYKTCVFTGTMSVEERERHKETFMTNPAYTVLLGTIGAAGVSHTFTAARNLIFYDSPWNPSDKDQASDRIYRIGTTESVNIFTLVTRDTVDDRVEEILSTKDGVAKYIVDNKLDLRNNPKLFNYLLGGDK